VNELRKEGCGRKRFLEATKVLSRGKRIAYAGEEGELQRRDPSDGLGAEKGVTGRSGYISGRSLGGAGPNAWGIWNLRAGQGGATKKLKAVPSPRRLGNTRESENRRSFLLPSQTGAAGNGERNGLTESRDQNDPESEKDRSKLT